MYGIVLPQAAEGLPADRRRHQSAVDDRDGRFSRSAADYDGNRRYGLLRNGSAPGNFVLVPIAKLLIIEPWFVA